MATSGAHRRLSLLLSASLLGASLLLGWIRARPAVDGDAALRMERADHYYDALADSLQTARIPTKVPRAAAIGLGYLERLRLGLGSPFRLADFALSDPRLDDSTRRNVAWALLARLRRGEAYVVDPKVADEFQETPFAPAASGSLHVDLITKTIQSASDPRAGELAVRLAYALAAGEGTLPDRADLVATQVAALVRDRVLAQTDLRELLQRSAQEHIDPLGEVVRRRRALELAVERPASEPLRPDVQTEAMRSVPDLLREIRGLHVRPEASALAGTARTWTASATLLGGSVAARLGTLAVEQPPESPVAITVRSHRGLLVSAELPADLRHARERFVSEALNGEALAAAYGSLLASGDTARRAVALTTLAAATALRTMSQEIPWFAGLPAPSVADLRTEFGLAGVTFESGVRAEWQPYYLRMIATSIRDAQRVLGGLSVAGLRLSVGVGGLPDTVLALHDPKTRTIRLSALSSAGTLAHELAHDLDWQAARRLYAGNGYSTDRAMREQRGALAASMRDLASARVTTRRGTPPDERPAEVFARSVDWLVAVSLAREGRSNGYLTAVQDAALTGNTTVSPVAMIFGAARPLLDAIQEMTYVPESIRQDFLEQWGDARTVEPYLLVRHALTVSVPRRRYGRAARLLDDGALGLTASEAVLCENTESSWAPELKVRQMLLDLALDSRALGIARLRAMYYPDDSRPAWAKSVLGLSPWAPKVGDDAVNRIRDLLAIQVDADRADQLRFATPTIFRPAATRCDGEAR